MPDNSKISQWSLTLLRVVVGFIFLYHGYLKLFMPGGFVGTVGFFTKIGIIVPNISALVVSIVEFLGGLFLIFGMAIRWTTFALIFEMLVAFFIIHRKNGLLVSNNGYEFVLLIMAALLLVHTNGAGRLSLGKMFKKKILQ